MEKKCVEKYENKLFYATRIYVHARSAGTLGYSKSRTPGTFFY